MNKTYRFTGQSLFEKRAETINFSYFGFLMVLLLVFQVLSY